MHVSIARYALGVASLLVICGSLGLAALALRRRFFAGWTGALARLTEVVIAFALLIGVLEVLGAAGLFRLVPVVVTSAALGWGIWFALGRPPPVGPRIWTARHAPPAQRIALGLGIAAATAVTAEWAALTIQSYDVGIRGFDSLWYHLPWAASFAQNGHVAGLRFTDVAYLTQFYPASSELVHGLGIVLLGRDTLSPALNLIWLGLALVAAWCIGRPRGCAPLTLLGAALALATMMMDYSQAGSAANDVVGVFLLLAAAALITNSEERLAPLVPAGLAAGLAIGTKLTLLGPTLALTAGAIAIAPAGRRRSAGGAWLGPLVLAGGFWYLRNLIAVGNPLPWTSFGVLPTPAPPLQQHTGFAFVHYLLDSRAWSHFFSPALASGLGRWWYLIVAAVIIGPLLCLLPGAGRTVRMLGLVALASLVAYVVTPETAAGPRGDPVGFGLNLRYAAPALTLSLAVLPLAPVWASPRRQAALAVAGIALLVATLAQAPLWPGRHVPAAVGVAVVLLVSALVLLRDRGLPRPALLAVAGALLLVVAIGGYPWQRHYLRGRYQFKPGVSYLARVWTFFRTVHHARVGIVGTFGGFFSYPLYGIDDSNRVQYIARRGPHGSFRPIRTCSGWRAAVNGGHFRYLLTTPARDPWRPKRLGPSPESGWTASDPAAHPILRQRATGQLIALYKLSGDLDAGACG